jgi:hypothetical protein
MSRITVTRRWPDGETIQVSVRADDYYPEALTVARVNCLEAFAEAVENACGTPLEAADAKLEDDD